MAKTFKEWMKPLQELEDGIAKLETLASRETDASKRREIEGQTERFKDRRDAYLETLFTRLGAWERVLLARAETRPYTLDYIAAVTTSFVELSGDRRIGDDKAIVGGPARIDGRPVIVLGHQKGRNIQERTFRNFAMAKPEGYRKAIRLFEMAERFRLPVVSFVDTPAADPGPESESRGISEAIAASMLVMFSLTVPVLSVVIGEGGSGGAIGIAAANRVLMLEHAVYSVIPPEGCAAILWRAPERGAQAAAALRLTAESALELGLIDTILAEPFGGAHRDHAAAGAIVKDAVVSELQQLCLRSPGDLKRDRYARFRAMGVYDSVGDSNGVGTPLASNRK